MSVENMSRIVTSYEPVIGRRREEWWDEAERGKAIEFYKNLVNSTEGEDRKRALNVYVQLLEGLAVCEDVLAYEDIETYCVKSVRTGNYFAGNINGEMRNGIRDVRITYGSHKDAVQVADGLKYLSGDDYEIEKEAVGERRVPDYDKLLADVGLAVKTSYVQTVDR